MAPQPLEPELLDHLRVEFGQHGHRAADLLSDAHAYLVLRTPTCRLREVVAHCLREALKSILASVGSAGAGGWRHVSREVVDARQRFGRAVEPGEDVEGALRDLLASIDDLSRFHDEEEGLHERRLIAVLLSRTGAAPLSAGTTPVRDYQNLLGRLDRAAHGGATNESAEELWKECAAISRSLFLPPEIRHAELERLAQLEDPTSADTKAVLGLLSSPGHLRHFLGNIESPIWLESLGATDVLDPSDTDGPWPPHVAVTRLAERYPGKITAWLQGMYASQDTGPVPAAQVCHAALNVGGPALSLVLAAVRDHPNNHGIMTLGVRAAEQADASAALVEDLADLILNPSSWRAALFVEPLLEQISAGANEDNSRRRISILVHKIRVLSDDDRLLRNLKWRRSGSIADTPARSTRDDRSWALLSCLLRLLGCAWAWTPASDLLDHLDRLPDSLRQRLRAWVLANALDVDAALIIDEIEHAISTRLPNGDDLALLDRAAAVCDASTSVAKWRAALGAAPDAEQVGRAAAANDMNQNWLRGLRWVPLLPDGTADSWAVACHILAERYGRSSRESLARRRPDFAQFAVSPISAEELRSLDPDNAAARVAEWRPGPDDWLGGAQEIARVLETVIKDNIEDWGSAPIPTAKKLRHPTYISHYLYALTAAVAAHELPVGDILDVIELVRTHPWPVEPLADDHRDYDTDWRETERAAVGLIKALADSDQGFDGRAAEAWDVLTSEASDRSEPSDIVSISTGPDLLNSAINRPCTRALEAAISLVAHEYRSSGTVRPEAIALFEDALRLVGTDGAEHRAVLASRIGFLSYALPEWTETNRDLLFGSRAPDGLGQLSVELAIEWSPPNRWLLENFPEAVHNAVRVSAEHAMEHMIIAMLWGCTGYSVPETVEFLRTSPELVSKSGHALASVLDDADVEASVVEVATDFWNAILETETGAAVEGFGWLAEVAAMNTETWEELTLRTIKAANGRIDWSHGIAKRLAASNPTNTGLALLNELVRGRLEEWDRLNVAETAADALSKANGLQDTDDYKRLRTTLLERGVIND